MNVLVVDDDKGARESLGVVLRRLGGHSVAEAINGKEAIDLARSDRYDAAFIDQGLPDMSGLDLLSALRGTTSADAALFIVTGFGTIEDAVTAIRLGALNYLQKQSVDPIRLLELLQQVPTGKLVKDPRIASTLRTVARHPTASITELAMSVSLSVSRLRHMFVTETGTALGVYVRAARLQRAALLLQSSFKSVHHIASDVGWADASSFCAAFRKRYGCTPMEYRHEHLNI